MLFYGRKVPFHWTLLIILIFPLILILNLINNFSIIDHYENHNQLTPGNKTFFWILSLLFSLLILSFLYSFITQIFTIKSYTASFPNQKVALIVKMKIMLGLTETLCGVAIIFYQYFFYYSINKNSKDALNNAVNEIGTTSL